MSPGKILIAFLLLSSAFVLAFPNVTIGPGRLSRNHSQIATQCWSCHQPFRGATFEKCTTCHKIGDIGRVTTSGNPLPVIDQRRKVLFHAGLANPECRACHLIHLGERHVRAATTFQHELLADAFKSDCASCHGDQKPADSLHRQVSTQCSACHKTAGWRPASFEHNSYFRFDSNHPSRCDSCHTDPASYSSYTCYGCHEHTPSGMAAKHAEEGIRNLDNCARCHRTGDAEESEKGRRDD